MKVTRLHASSQGRTREKGGMRVKGRTARQTRFCARDRVSRKGPQGRTHARRGDVGGTLQEAINI